MDNTIDNTFESANRVYDTTGIAPTVNTCGGGGLQPKIVEVKKLNDDIKPILLGGVGEENEFGKQYRQGNRVYDSDGIAMAITSQPIGNAGGNSYLYCTKEKVSDAQSLRMVRTEEDKALRKAYENGEIHHGFNEHRTAEPRNDDVSNTITTVQKDNLILEQQIVAMCGRNPDNPSDRTPGAHLEQRLESNEQGICNCLTSVSKDNMVLEKKNYKNPTLTTENIPGVIELGNPKFHNFLYEIDGDIYLIRIRKLTPKECWKLMDFSDEDFKKAAKVNSSTQLYKQAGNSIVKNVLVAIMGQLFEDKEDVYKNI